MEDVTDAAFRTLIARYSKPSVMFTEFTSADGLVLADEKGQMRLRKKLIFSEQEHPIVAQLFSATPEHMERASCMVAELGFDGIDINMGCPDASVVKSGCGAALIKTPDLARQLIRAAQNSGLPVSVKTRIGDRSNELATWLPELLAEEPSVVTIHARTRKELSLVPARWEHVAEAVRIRDALGSRTLILGNGDVRDMTEARRRVEETNCDGVMFGRAIYGNPWLFAKRYTPPTPQEKVAALMGHLTLFEELLSDTTQYAIMKKHFKAYISGWDRAKELRVRLMETDRVADALAVLRSGILPA